VRAREQRLHGGLGACEGLREVHGTSTCLVMANMDDKIVLVTGAGRGIGREVALRLAAEGAKVVVNDLGCDVHGEGADGTVAEAVADEILTAGGEAVVSDHDVRTREGAEGSVRVALEAYGQLDVLVASAGIVRDRTLLKMDEAWWDDVLVGNAKSAFLTIQAAARQMVAQGTGGRIVAMTGLPGYLGGFSQSNFAAASGAIHGLVRTAAIELQKHKITVNAVAPLAQTRLTETLPILQGFDNVTADRVAPVVLTLASDVCGSRTGFVLAVAGARVYAMRFQESSGVFKDDDSAFTPEEIDDNWHAIVKM